MEIVETYPPNITLIKQHFPIHKNTVFTYGDTLYNPHGGYIDSSLLAHEATHTKQQCNNPDEWWNKYIEDKDFRLSQELEAYRVQYKHYCTVEKDRNKRYAYLLQLAKDLSSPLYGDILSTHKSITMIRQ